MDAFTNVHFPQSDAILLSGIPSYYRTDFMREEECPGKTISETVGRGQRFFYFEGRLSG